MKKIFYLTALMFISFTVKAQWTGFPSVTMTNGVLNFNQAINIQTNPGIYEVGRGGGFITQNADVITGGIFGIRQNNNWQGALTFYTHDNISGNTFGTTFTEKMRLTSEGNLGIGTSSPSSSLDIENNFNGSTFLEISNNSTGNLARRGITIGNGSTGNSLYLLSTSANYDQVSGWSNAAVVGTDSQLSNGLIMRTSVGKIRFQPNGIADKIVFDQNGYVGIGATNPATKLHIEGTSSTYSRIANSGGNTRLTFGAVTGRNIIYSGTYSGAAQTLKLQVNNENNFVINTNGNIGVGTMTTGSHKLAVEGTIGAREIKVEATGWSDFVFEKDYDLRTLEEVEEHINEKGHLPEIPNEAEVTENGIKLGEMNAKLLQKIEELTLYLIEQNKQNQAQQAKIELLEKKISQLENK